MSQVTNYLVLPASIGLVRAGEVSTGDPSRVLLPILRLRGPETRCSSALSLPLLNMVRLRLQTLFNLRFCQEIRVNFKESARILLSRPALRLTAVSI